MTTAVLQVRPVAQAALRIAAVMALAWVPLGLAPLTIAVGVTIAAALLAGAPLLRYPGWRWNLALVLWAAFGVLVTVLGGLHERPLHRPGLLYYWLAFPAGLAAFAEARARRWALIALSVSLALAAALACAQMAIGYDADASPLRISSQGLAGARPSGFLNGYLTYGAVLALVSPLFIPLTRPWSRWRIAGLAASVIGLALSGARLAFVGIVAGWSVLVACTGGARRLLLGAGAFLGLSLVCALLLLANNPQRLLSMLQGQDGRVVMWSITAGMIVERPLIGWGGRRGFQDGYEPRYRAWLAEGGTPVQDPEPRPPHAHNLGLVLASEHGIPALLCHLGFLGAVLLACWRERARDREALARVVGVMAVWLAAGQFNNLVGQGESAFAFYLALAWAAAPLLCSAMPEVGRACHPALPPGQIRP